MKHRFIYKDYSGSAECDLDGGCLYGQILFINDVITYEAKGVEELRREFELAVDDYIETCKEIGKDPQKSFKGTFNVRVGPELHKKAALLADTLNISLNDFVKEAITKKLGIEERKASATTPKFLFELTKHFDGSTDVYITNNTIEFPLIPEPDENKSWNLDLKLSKSLETQH